MTKRVESIYEQYCNDFHNPALGAYIIVKFVESFYKHASSDKSLNILYLFAVMPLVMNVNFRNCIGNKIILNSLIASINKNKKLFGSYHDAIDRYKEYTLCCLIFALRLGFVSLGNDAVIKLEAYNLPDHTNILVRNAAKMGTLFAKGDLYSFLGLLGVKL